MFLPSISAHQVSPRRPVCSLPVSLFLSSFSFLIFGSFLVSLSFTDLISKASDVTFLCLSIKIVHFYLQSIQSCGGVGQAGHVGRPSVHPAAKKQKKCHTSTGGGSGMHVNTSPTRHPPPHHHHHPLHFVTRMDCVLPR